MFLLLYGEDTFRSREKLEAIKRKYLDAALSDTNLIVLDGKTATVGEIIRQCSALPFLAKTRLVILKNFLASAKKEAQEKMVDFLERLPETTILIFYEEGLPDKRSILFKKLNLKNKAEEFALLSGDKLNQWMKQRVENLGGEIDWGGVDVLGRQVGPNLWRASSEIEKLLAFNRKINQNNILSFVRPEIAADIFEAIGFLGRKNKKNALRSIHSLLEEGENELYIFTMIIYQFRNLLLVKKTAEKNANQYSLAKHLGLHPFVVSKALADQKFFSFNELKKIYRTLLDFDWRMKVGKIEPRVVLDLLVVNITQT